MPDIRIAWWNVENLFDHENAPRSPELARRIHSELEGWTIQIRNRKLDAASTALSKVNPSTLWPSLWLAKSGPAITALCFDVITDSHVQPLISPPAPVDLRPILKTY